MTGRDPWDPDGTDRPDDIELVDETWAAGRRGGGTRWLLLLLVIPVVALVVMQLGPSGDPDAAPTPTASTATTPRHTSSPSPSGSGSGEAGPTRGSRPVVRRVGHPVLGVTAGWELFARSHEAVYRVQLAKGEVTTTAVPPVDEQSMVTFLVTDHNVIASSPFGPGETTYYVPDGRAVRVVSQDTELGLACAGALFAGPDLDHLWSTSMCSEPPTVLLLHSDLTPTGTDLQVPAGTASGVGSDGFGTVLVHTPGGVYELGARGPRRITSGGLVGAGPTGWLAVECDDVNRCTRFMIARETRERRPLPGAPPRELAALGTWGGSGLGSISPDGATMASLGVGPMGPTLHLVDLSSGERRSVGLRIVDPSLDLVGGAVAWSPDGGRLFVPGDTGTVQVVDVPTGEATELGLDLDGVVQVAVRPAS